MTATLETLLDEMLERDDATEAEWLSLPAPESRPCDQGKRHHFPGEYRGNGSYQCQNCGVIVNVARSFCRSRNLMQQAKPGSLKPTKAEAAQLADRPLIFNA